MLPAAKNKKTIMRKLLPLFALLALISTTSIAQPDKYYTVQVGTFIDAQPSDFEQLKPVGFVHARNLGGNLREVYVGGYTSREEAEAAAANARNNGYANAFVQERFLNEGQQVPVVQMATRRVDRDIEWEEFLETGPLYAILKGNLIKIVTEPQPNAQAAQQKLEAIRKMGYKDAFIKTINSVYLHRLTEFETGAKKPLIPISFEENTGRINTGQPPQQSQPQPQPSSYNVLTARTPDAAARGYDYNVGEPADYSYYSGERITAEAEPVTLPNIRSNIKRASVLELQKVLKAEKAYTGSLDGYYGNGTASGYQQMLKQDRTLNKYQLLSRELNLPGTQAGNSELQSIIDRLPNDASAAAAIERFNEPIARAYRAYNRFVSFGPSTEVNNLMNSAINAAFSGRGITGLPFDPTATYAYQDLGQLVLHLHYIHCATDTDIAAPCWLSQRYPEESSRAYIACGNVPNANLRIQGCGQFESWPEVRMLVAIAADLNAEEELNKQRLAQAASERARLYMAPSALNSTEAKAVNAWNDNLVKGLDNWIARDPLHQKLGTAFKVAYYQSQVRLEDFFITKGYNTGQARGLALATLHTLVAYHMQRFV